MFGGKKVTIDKDLHEKIRAIAEVAGYASADEFVVHALERAIADFEGAESDEEIRKKLKGLGYIS